MRGMQCEVNVKTKYAVPSTQTRDNLFSTALRHWGLSHLKGSPDRFGLERWNAGPGQAMPFLALQHCQQCAVADRRFNARPQQLGRKVPYHLAAYECLSDGLNERFARDAGDIDDGA